MEVRKVLVISWALFLGAVTVAECAAPATDRFDRYGGLLNVKGKATGFFHVEKIKDRFWFITPEGHGFWSIGVNFVSDSPRDGKDDRGNTYTDNILRKYGNKPLWASETSKKLLKWNFNTVGAGSSSYIDPNGMYHRRQTDPPIVTAYKKRFGLYAAREKGVANILEGLRGGGFFPDVFDPRFGEWVETEASMSGTTGGLEVEKNSPWILGFYTDEELRGFGSRTRHAHLGWAAGAARPGTWTKRAWRDFLKNKYGTLERLNSAYSSSYTTWESGGSGGGGGVLDETGLGDFIKGSPVAAVKADQDEFLYVIARRYFEITTAMMRKYHPNHLILGPMFSTWDNAPRDEVIRAASDLVDVLGVSADADHNHIYRLTGKPTMVYTWWVTAEPDSPLRSRCADQSCVSDQRERGLSYRKKINALANLRAEDGTFMVIGAHWWKHSDNGPEYWEQRNFGVVTIKDNAYDGVEAAVGEKADVGGYRTGGEAFDYGDFLGWVSRANKEVMEALSNGVTAASGAR